MIIIFLMSYDNILFDKTDFESPIDKYFIFKCIEGICTIYH